MKYSLALLLSLSSAASAFTPGSSCSTRQATTAVSLSSRHETDDVGGSCSRLEFMRTLALTTVAVSTAGFLVQPQPALATGRATLDQSYQRYAPRIRAGGDFYGGELKQLVLKSDWTGIKNALQQIPDRTKQDLQKVDSGVAERARQAGQFSNERVLVAAELFASSFTQQNSITPKAKKMKAAVEKLRDIVSEMQSVTRQALGEEKSGGGLFGLGAKQPSQAELSNNIRQLYVQGGNAWNEYIFAANENLALQYDKFNFVK